MRVPLVLASFALVALATAIPSASASECLLYTGDHRSPDVGVNIPFVHGGYGSCDRDCPGVVSVDAGGADGCVLPQLSSLRS